MSNTIIDNVSDVTCDYTSKTQDTLECDVHTDESLDKLPDRHPAPTDPEHPNEYAESFTVRNVEVFDGVVDETYVHPDTTSHDITYRFGWSEEVVCEVTDVGLACGSEDGILSV